MNSNRLLLVVTGSVAALIAGAAHAQAPSPEVVAPDVETVVVTGSRLTNTGFQAPTPVTVLGAAQLEARAATTIFDLTKDIPVFRSSTGLNNAVFGVRFVGQATLDLRGLGNIRTLTLIDGIRPQPVTGAFVFDTNMIPASLVERTEVTTGGASAAYGSDAVAGVVNFILKKRLDGFTGTVQHGRSQRGDNKENLISLAWGTSFLDDRAHFIIGGDYNDNSGVTSFYDREWGRREPGLLSLPANRPAGLPSQIFSDYVEMSANTGGGVIHTGPLKGTAFDLNGNPYQLQQGTIVGATEMVSPNQTNYLNTDNSWQNIKAPYERGAAMARLEYEISPNLRAYGTASYGELWTHTTLLGYSPTNIVIGRDNPFLPASVQQAMVANNLQTIPLSKLGSSRNHEFGPWRSGNILKNFNATLGLQGTVFGTWKWDAGYQQGRNNFKRAFLNVPKSANYYASLYVVRNAQGTPVCGPVATNPMFNAQDAATRAIWINNLEPGCVPYNPFGTRNASPEAIRYINGDSKADEDLRQRSAQFNISGEPFMLPAGPVSIAVGAEWRKDVFNQKGPYEDRPLFLVTENNVSYDAETSTKEAYAEIGVPLLKDLPFVQQLDVNGAVRRTDYSASGGVNTWKVGATWEVNELVRFRATRSRDIRAPNITELYLPGQGGLAPLTNRVNGVTAQVPILTSGNPNLTPEIANTFTAGVVFQPTWEWAWGARMSVDYYSIDIKDVITALPNQEIVDRYFVQGLKEYASFLVLDNSPIGFNLIKPSTFNLNKQKTNGVDLELSMRPPIDALGLPGRLDFRGLATWVDDLRTLTVANGVVQDLDTAGQFVPDWTMNFNFTYVLDRLSANVSVRYTTNIKYSPTLKGPDDPAYNPAANNSINRNRFPSSTLWNTTLSYNLIQEGSRRLQLFGMVENLFDKKPPLVGLLVVPGGNPYDLVGRNFKAGVRFSF